MVANVLFYLFAGLFLVFEFLFGLSILDYSWVGVMDMGVAQETVATGIALSFFLGTFIGFRILRSPAQQQRSFYIKVLLTAYFALTPLIFLLPPAIINIYWYLAGGLTHANSGYLIFTSLIVMVLFAALAFLLWLVWSFDFFWREYRKSQLAMLGFFVCLASAAVMYFASIESMATGAQLFLVMGL